MSENFEGYLAKGRAFKIFYTHAVILNKWVLVKPTL
jgi:hypothetical protein